jgi:hypothetical protein
MKRLHKKELNKILELGDPAIKAAVLEIFDDIIRIKDKAQNELNGYKRRNAKGELGFNNIRKYVLSRLLAHKDSPQLHIYINTITHNASVRKRDRDDENLAHVGSYSKPYEKAHILEDLECALSEITSPVNVVSYL